MQLDATIFIARFLLFGVLRFFVLFRLFQRSFQASILPYLSLTESLPTTARRCLCPIRSTGATIHKCFMWSLLPAIAVTKS